jgi:HlyD family secretion protein
VLRLGRWIRAATSRGEDIGQGMGATTVEPLDEARGAAPPTTARATRRLASLGPALGRGAGRAAHWLRTRPRAALGVLAGVALLVAATLLLGRSFGNGALTAPVRRGDLVVRLTETGTLRPAESITYRSPLPGRELEIVFLVPEGTRVQEGDLLVRMDTTELKRELERAGQDVRQALVEVQVAEAETQDGVATIDSLEHGEGALSVEEARSALRLAEKKAERVREEYESLKPLLERGFITREELDRSAFELEQAEVDLNLARRKAEVYIQQTRPRGQQRARLQLAQKKAQLGNAQARVAEARGRLQALQEVIEACSLYARRPGLVVYEEFLMANPRRKIRVGDRVTQSQGLVTIPEVTRMLVEASVNEADVHRVKPGQPATVRLDAFPDLRLTGSVERVGTLARASVERPFEEKRFDLVVELDKTDAELRPEMTARVDVLVGEHKNVLLMPVNAVFDRQGVLVAHRVGFFGVETRQIELGDANELEVEVEAGLAEGDRVALTDVSAGAPARGAEQVPAATGGDAAFVNR